MREKCLREVRLKVRYLFVAPAADVDFESFVRALNRIGYAGPLSIEWEDSGMDREWGAQDALASQGDICWERRANRQINLWGNLGFDSEALLSL